MANFNVLVRNTLREELISHIQVFAESSISSDTNNIDSGLTVA